MCQLWKEYRQEMNISQYNIIKCVVCICVCVSLEVSQENDADSPHGSQLWLQQLLSASLSICTVATDRCVCVCVGVYDSECVYNSVCIQVRSVCVCVCMNGYSCLTVSNQMDNHNCVHECFCQRLQSWCVCVYVSSPRRSRREVRQLCLWHRGLV